MHRTKKIEALEQTVDQLTTTRRLPSKSSSMAAKAKPLLRTAGGFVV